MTVFWRWPENLSVTELKKKQRIILFALKSQNKVYPGSVIASAYVSMSLQREEKKSRPEKLINISVEWNKLRV